MIWTTSLPREYTSTWRCFSRFSLTVGVASVDMFSWDKIYIGFVKITYHTQTNVFSRCALINRQFCCGTNPHGTLGKFGSPGRRRFFEGGGEEEGAGCVFTLASSRITLNELWIARKWVSLIHCAGRSPVLFTFCHKFLIAYVKTSYSYVIC